MPVSKESRKTAVIIGAGDAGNLLMNEINQNPDLNYKVVAFVDHKKDIGIFRKSIAKVFSILLSIVLIVASIYIYKGNPTLNEMTGANVQTTRYSVIVLNENTFDNVKFLKGKTIQMCNINDKEGIVKKAINALEKKSKKQKLKR